MLRVNVFFGTRTRNMHLTCRLFVLYMYSNNTGGWSEEGVTLDSENTYSTTITCVTTHLTSFAVLFQGVKKVSNYTTTVYLSVIQTILT